jgi:glycosyltransferase involved in cell wall biosynthesis
MSEERSALEIVVLTTSYPRSPGDYAGTFVAAAVEQLRRLGHEVRVVSPQDFRHFGIAYGHGVMGNLRRRPWLIALVPLMLLNYRRAARRAARGADLIHAYWLPSGAVALGLGAPVVLQLPGTDILLARRLKLISRPVIRRAQAIICPSNELADEARALGARRVRVVTPEFPVPAEIARETSPNTVLFAGRLSPEKGIRELVRASEGLELVVVGDGPLRSKVPQATGFVAHEEMAARYDACAVVACPSFREGFGMVCAEAMAHARPVVACPVGGLKDMVVDGETGIFVPPGDVEALRAALERLLADPGLRERMGEAGRRRILERFTWGPMLDRLLETYDFALASAGSAND